MSDFHPGDDIGNCFVCGPTNPLGLRVKFELTAGVCRGRFTPASHHCGYDKVTHGGILFSVLDDVMANWLILQGARAFTAKCEIRYREPLPIGTPVDLEARLKLRKRRLVMLTATARRCDTQQVVAEADASFMLNDAGPLAETVA
jgi:acyl-coenzyme A thioesterase PaaI-like protein